MAKLRGMKEICEHCNRSEATIIQWIHQYSFPAKKTKGLWTADTKRINRWRRQEVIKEFAAEHGQLRKRHARP